MVAALVRASVRVVGAVSEIPFDNFSKEVADANLVSIFRRDNLKVGRSCKICGKLVA